MRYKKEIVVLAILFLLLVGAFVKLNAQTSTFVDPALTGQWQQGALWVYYISDTNTAQDWLARSNAGQVAVLFHSIPGGQFNVLYARPTRLGVQAQWTTVVWVYYSSDAAASVDWIQRANTGWQSVLWYADDAGQFHVLYAK